MGGRGRALGSVDTGKARRAPVSEENLSSGLVAGGLLLSRVHLLLYSFPSSLSKAVVKLGRLRWQQGGGWRG